MASGKPIYCILSVFSDELSRKKKGLAYLVESCMLCDISLQY